MVIQDQDADHRRGVVLAVVDIGTNTLKFTVARCFSDGSIVDLEAQAETVRIGAGIETTGKIDPARAQRAVEALKAFAAIAQKHGAIECAGVATETLRVASNGEDLLARIAAETSWKIGVISGTEEARLTFVGLRDLLPEHGRVCIVDIGGGSTEWISAEHGEMCWSKSIPIGSGRLADRFFQSDPPGQLAIATTIGTATDVFAEAVDRDYRQGDALRLSGGNGQFIDKLRLLLGFGDMLNGNVVGRILEFLAQEPAVNVAKMLGIAEERARVLPAGVAIAAAGIKASEPTDVASVPSGIRIGLLRELAGKYY
ncbi:MAG: Ppx/GppA phosphatase family protein [Thermomicrobiales bacterium]